MLFRIVISAQLFRRRYGITFYNPTQFLSSWEFAGAEIASSSNLTEAALMEGVCELHQMQIPGREASLVT